MAKMAKMAKMAIRARSRGRLLLRLPQAHDIPVRILQPGTAGGADLGDEVDGLRRLVLQERHALAPQRRNGRLDVVDLEVRQRVVRLGRAALEDRQLRPAAAREADG